VSATTSDPARTSAHDSGPPVPEPDAREPREPKVTPATADPDRPDRTDRPDPTNRADPAGSPDAGLEIKIIVALAVVAGLGLRFVAPSPLWLDEALSVNIARLPLGQIPDALQHDGHPPLYYALLHGWMQVLGTGDVAVRALSGVFAVVTLPVAYLVGRRAGGRALGWLTLGLFSLSPFVLRYATETRMYALIMLLVLLAYLTLDDIMRRHRDGWWRVAALGLLTAALLYTHYWAMWLLAGTAVVLAYVSWRTPDPATRRAGRRGLLAMVGGGVVFLPWVPVLLFQARHTGTPWAGPQRPTSLVASTLTDLGGGNFTDAELVGAVVLILVLLGVFGVAVSNRRIDLDLHTAVAFRPEAAVVAATITLGSLVGIVTRSAYATRYAATFVPLVLLLAAGGIACFSARRIRAGVLVGVLGLSSLGALYNVTTDRTQVEVLAASVATHMHPDDVVVYCPDQLGPSSLRAMPPGLDNVAFPSMTPPDRVDWVDYTQRNSADPREFADRVVDRAGPGRAVFVVWSGAYKTHNGTCEALVARLAERLPGQRQLIGEDGDSYYEHANLSYFPPAAAPPP
jgi:mannosyltransferase